MMDIFSKMAIRPNVNCSDHWRRLCQEKFKKKKVQEKYPTKPESDSERVEETDNNISHPFNERDFKMQYNKEDCQQPGHATKCLSSFFRYC